MSTRGKAVCPTAEELQYGGPVRCPVEGCEKELPSSSCLRMHVTRRHQGRPLGPGKGRSLRGPERKEFFCPVSSCSRGRGGQPFPRLSQLKQHYHTIHGQKRHVCGECGKCFALHDVYRRHQDECQQKITCATCGLDFRTRNALYNHAKRNGHTLPEGRKSKTLTSSAKKRNPKPRIVLLPVSISLKAVIPIATHIEATSSSTQTIPGNHLGDTQASNPSSTQTHNPNSTQANNPINALIESSSDTETNTETDASCPTLVQTANPTTSQVYSPPSAQTNPDHRVACYNSSPPSLSVSLSPTSSSFAELHSAGSQTVDQWSPAHFSLEQSSSSLFCSASELLSFGTQTNFSLSSSSTGSLFPSTSSQACQTRLTPHCDFGTQTRVDADRMTRLLMIGADHTHSNFGPDDSNFNLVEFGTQTADSHIFFNDTVDFGTQTSGMSNLELDGPFCGHSLLPPECLEFGTQTLESCVPHMQTLLCSSDTRDQSSQTQV